MALTSSQKCEITHVVCASLDAAEAVWGAHGKELMKTVAKDAAIFERADSQPAEILPSRIPLHSLVDGSRPKVANFIALVADMRQSSNHLLCDISEKRADVTLLKRVYYETSALLPALEKTLTYEGGAVTEYLGDGILSLFSVDDDDNDESIRKAFRSAKNCVGDTRGLVNDELNSRYRLPSLDIGVGLSYSKALVQLVGIPGNMHPKVIGNCVYYASKLSAGINEIYVDEAIRKSWPKSEGGKLNFIKKTLRSTDGFLVF